MQSDYPSIALTLLAALLFSLGNQTSRYALNYATPSRITLYQIGVSVSLYRIAAPFYMQTSYWLSPAVFFLAAAGLLRPLVSANPGTVTMDKPAASVTMSSDMNYTNYQERSTARFYLRIRQQELYLANTMEILRSYCIVLLRRKPVEPGDVTIVYR